MPVADGSGRLDGSIWRYGPHSIPFEPKRRALAAPDAQADERAPRFAPAKFLQAGEHESGASGPYGVTQGDGSAIDV
jgi:hypothetical protein